MIPPAISLPRRADAQMEQPLTWCRYCKGEIYEGEEFYLVDGRAICSQCLDKLARDYFRLYKVKGGT